MTASVPAEDPRRVGRGTPDVAGAGLERRGMLVGERARLGPPRGHALSGGRLARRAGWGGRAAAGTGSWRGGPATRPPGAPPPPAPPAPGARAPPPPRHATRRV